MCGEASRVPRRHVRDLVRHQTGKLGFAIDFHDQSLVDIKKAAGQGEGYDIRGIDHLNGEVNLSVGVAGDFLAETVYVVIDIRIVDELGVEINRCRHRLSNGSLFLQGIEIRSLTYAPLPNAVNVILARLLCL